MTFEQYWAILRKRWKFILVCFVLMGIGTYIGNKFVKPSYQSTVLVQVAVGSSTSDINNLLASDQLVQTEAIVTTSDPVLREVASHYKGMTVDKLMTEVTATIRMNTQIFEIDVVDTNPTLAAAIANDTAATLIEQQQQAVHQETAQGGFLVVVQSAVPSQNPIQSSKMIIIAAGLLAGLFLGMLLAILFEQFDPKVHTAEDLMKLLSWPILTTVWQSKSEEVISSSNQNPNAESYRMLRTNIVLSVIKQPLHSLLITSATPREGKSVVAANLAIFMANTGKKTLLVDANLHQPAQYTQFGLPETQAGLIDAIVECNKIAIANLSSQQRLLSPLSSSRNSNMPNFSLDPFMHSVGIPNLQIMPAGSPSPNATELLASQAMPFLMSSIENCGADVVIIDAAPLLGLSDTSILAVMVDATLFVVDITHAYKKSLKQAKALIAQTGAQVLGCVVNKQLRRRGATLYDYYLDAPYTFNNHTRRQSSEINQGMQNGHTSIDLSSPFISASLNEQNAWPNLRGFTNVVR